MADIANPSFRTRLQGYDRDQVHKMVDRIARTLAGTARNDAIRVAELQYVYLDVKVGGYDRSQVHEYINDAIAALRRRALAA